MKKLIGTLVVGVMAAGLFSACVPITYTRSITVHKDANGNITGTDVFESMTEPHNETPKVKEMQGGATSFQYLKP